MKITPEMARLHPTAWAMYASEGRWRRSYHLQVLAEYLWKVHTGEIKRLCISFPPRHGKSEFVTKYFASWWLGTHPQDEVIVSSYAQRLTEQWSVASRDLLAAYGSRTFGVTTGGRANKSMWNVKDANTGRKLRGSLFATGKGGAMTGRGADLLICDDLIRDAEEAANPAQRDKCWEWLQSVAFTRLSPKGAAIIIGTRWHYDDPIGRLERIAGTDEEGEPWHFVNFPAIADSEADVLGRKPGEALWPERFPVDHLHKIKNQVGPYVWEALYQGSPTPSEGGFFKKPWFRYFRQDKGRIVPTAEAKGAAESSTSIKARALKRFATVDLAVSTKDNADYTCALVWGIDMDNKRLLLLDVHRLRLEGPDIVPMLQQLHARHELLGIYVEAVAFQLSIIQEAMRQGLPVRRLTPDKDKVARAIPATCIMEQEAVYFREGAPWLPALETEILQFPRGVHDDQVDCLAYASQIFLDVMQAKRRRRPNRTGNADMQLSAYLRGIV
jgi:predicted phage terminase large subunit-like protein